MSAEKQRTAESVHAQLVEAIDRYHEAERTAVFLFGEVLTKRLYRCFNCASIEDYARLKLGFSPGKTAQFVRLTLSLRTLPKLRRAVHNGDIPWTQARTLSTVVTPENESHWVERAKRTSRRELSQEIARAREAGISRRVSPAVTVTLRFSGEQLARFETWLEAERKQGQRGTREELIIGALGAGRTLRSRVITHVCATCARAETPTSRGNLPVDPAELAAQICDGELIDQRGRARSAVPNRLRRRVLTRDGHRCQMRGCKNARFLEVHHRQPLSRGGTDAIDNLITLCGGCHRALHQHEFRQQDTRVPSRDSPRRVEARTRT